MANSLKIMFDASTMNGTIVKNMKLTPSMLNEKIYSSFSNILFIPTIKLKKTDFESDLGEDDIKKTFLSPNQFNNFLVRLHEKREFKPISIAEAKKRGIIHSNILFILNLFLKKGTNISIHNKSFTINNINWNNQYTLEPVENSKIPRAIIHLDLILHEGKNISFIESTKLNCMQKRQDIINDYRFLVGLKKKSKKTASLQHIPVDIKAAEKKAEEERKKKAEEKRKKKAEERRKKLLEKKNE